MPAGEPLGPGLIYRDNRAVAEADEIRAPLRRRGHPRPDRAPVRRRSTSRPSCSGCGATTRTPGDRAALALQPRDWVVLALTGEAVTDGTHAAATLVYDLRRRRWDDELLAGAGPRLRRCSRGSGARTRWSGRCGRDRGPARTARLDAGRPRRRRQPGLRLRRRRRRARAGLRDGRLVDLSQRGRRDAARPCSRSPTTRTSIGDDFTTETGINTTGAAVAWVADRALWRSAGPRDDRPTTRGSTARRRRSSPARTGSCSCPSSATASGPTPSLRGAITGLSLRHDRAAIARAVLEGVAFAIRDQLELLRAGGAPVTELRVSGGDARLGDLEPDQGRRHRAGRPDGPGRCRA